MKHRCSHDSCSSVKSIAGIFHFFHGILENVRYYPTDQMMAQFAELNGNGGVCAWQTDGHWSYACRYLWKSVRESECGCCCGRVRVEWRVSEKGEQEGTRVKGCIVVTSCRRCVKKKVKTHRPDRWWMGWMGWTSFLETVKDDRSASEVMKLLDFAVHDFQGVSNPSLWRELMNYVVELRSPFSTIPFLFISL